MPQIAQISEIYASQLFWLVIVFGLIYFVIGRGMVPKIEATVDQRDKQIASDLAEAERARARADEVEELVRQQTERNRAEALKVTAAAKDEAARANEQRLKAADSANEARVAEAEERIRVSAASAMAEIETVATQAAQDMVAKLSGTSVSYDEASGAVKAALTHG
jgi:F-type H+-transporting ATPase subunit b